MDTRADAEDWLYHEAALLDEGRLDEWLALWTDDLTYLVPLGGEGDRPEDRLAIIHDDRQRLDERIFRISSGSAHAEEPRTETSRLVGNVRLDHDTGLRVVRSTFSLTALRKGAERTYAGRALHHLVWEEPVWKLSRKTVHLLARGERLGNLTFIL